MRVLAGQESFRLMSMLQANAWVVLEGEEVWPRWHLRARAGLGSPRTGAAGERSAVMKQVNLQLFGAFSDLDASREIAVDVAGGTVADLRQALRELLPQRWPQFRAGLLDLLGIRRPATRAARPRALPDDGRVAILPPVRLSDEQKIIAGRVDRAQAAIDPAEGIAGWSDPVSGGIDVFIGKVRDVNIGRPVTGITYDLFEPLVLNEFKRAAAEVEAAVRSEAEAVWWPMPRAGLASAMWRWWWQAGSPHRDEAFRPAGS
jgi:molybdopterin synthase catalytic subunit/molybdopterin converting factor small subunit